MDAAVTVVVAVEAEVVAGDEVNKLNYEIYDDTLRMQTCLL